MPKIEARVAGILVKGEEILLVNHKKHGRSYWVLPGGHVEFGETLEEALIRELNEELALDVTVGPLVIVHDFITEDRHVVNSTFLIEAKTTEFTLSPGHTLKAAQWVPLSGLADIDLLPAISDVIRKVVKNPPKTTLYLGRI